MSASLGELQVHADALLVLLGVRLWSGQIILHFDQGKVLKAETRAIHKPRNGQDRTEGFDTMAPRVHREPTR